MDIVEKRFDIQIATKGQTVTGKFELDKTVKVIKICGTQIPVTELL
jgi:hypothetical protein